MCEKERERERGWSGDVVLDGGVDGMMGKVGGVGMKKSVFFLCAENERIPLLRSYFFRVQGWVEGRGGRVRFRGRYVTGRVTLRLYKITARLHRELMVILVSPKKKMSSSSSRNVFRVDWESNEAKGEHTLSNPGDTTFTVDTRIIIVQINNFF